MDARLFDPLLPLEKPSRSGYEQAEEEYEEDGAHALVDGGDAHADEQPVFHVVGPWAMVRAKAARRYSRCRRIHDTM